MIFNLPENRKKILDYLNNVDEDTFIEEIVIPFFGSHGYQVYRINSHGPGEHGKDLIFCKYVPIFFENEYIAVQAKAEEVTTLNVGKYSDQLKRALNTGFAPHSSTGILYPHYAVFINARKHTNDAYTEFPDLVKSTHAKILSQENVCELIIQSGIAPQHLLKQLSINTPEVQSKEDKLVFETILGNNPAEIDNFLDHKIKFLRDEIGPRTKELIIDYIYDRWLMNNSWIGTIKPMKWFDLYFDFISQKQSKYLLKIFEELMSSTPSFDALSNTQSIVRKVTPELLRPIENEFVNFCALRAVSFPRERIELLFLKLGEFIQSNLIINSENFKLAKMTLQLEQYKKEKNKEKYKELRDSIYYKIYPEEQDQ